MVWGLQVRVHGGQPDQSQALADRLGRGIGNCPTCHSPVTGLDLLVAGRCPNADCQAGLASLFISKPKGLNEPDVLLLMGALGLVLGIAMIQAKSR